MKELSTLNLTDEYQGSLVAKRVPKHCGKSTHEDKLNKGQCKNLDRNGMKGIFHTNSMRRLMKPLLCNAGSATPYPGLSLRPFSGPAGRIVVMTLGTGLPDQWYMTPPNRLCPTSGHHTYSKALECNS